MTYDRDRMIRRINNTIPVECFAHTTAQSVGLHHAAMTWLLDEIDRLRAVRDAAQAWVDASVVSSATGLALVAALKDCDR